MAGGLHFKEHTNVCFVHIVSGVIANTVYYEMAESTMRAIISLDQVVELTEDDNPSFINHDSDWVSVLGNCQSLNCVFLAIYKRIFYFCRNQAGNLWMNLWKNS